MHFALELDTVPAWIVVSDALYKMLGMDHFVEEDVLGILKGTQ